MRIWEEAEAELLVALQRGIPLVEQPFEAIGQKFGFSEEAVLAVLHKLRTSGESRRFGAVFDARRLGFRSALCAMTLPRVKLAELAQKVAAVNGVTHAYERGWPVELSPELPGGPGEKNWPNLWFTLAAPAKIFCQELERLRSACQPYAIHELPATRRFKIDVVFDVRTRDRDEQVEPRPLIGQSSPPVIEPDAFVKRAVHLLQGDLPLCSRFFEPLARELEMSEATLLAQLCEWQAAGLLRRFGVLLRHREIGFKANGMCCWDMPAEEVEEAGRRVASASEVTHCYERPRMDIFPFRLYAMIHTTSWEGARQLYERITRDAGLQEGQLLLSLTEFKKTSMQFF